MNYIEHSIIGVGTAGACVELLHLAGVSQPDAITLLIGASAIVAGAICTDIDHPRAYVSRALPAGILRQLVPHLVFVAVFVTGMSMLTQQSIVGNLTRLSQLSLVKWCIAGILLALGLLVASRLFNISLGHRGALHSLAASAAATLAAIGFSIWATSDWGAWWIGALFGYGYLTHVLTDALTPTGVPLWHPFSKHRVRLIGKLRSSTLF